MQFQISRDVNNCHFVTEGDSFDLAGLNDGDTSLTNTNTDLTEENLLNSMGDMRMPADELLMSPNNEFECINIISDEEIFDNGTLDSFKTRLIDPNNPFFKFSIQ